MPFHPFGCPPSVSTILPNSSNKHPAECLQAKLASRSTTFCLLKWQARHNPSLLSLHTLYFLLFSSLFRLLSDCCSSPLRCYLLFLLIPAPYLCFFPTSFSLYCNHSFVFENPVSNSLSLPLPPCFSFIFTTNFSRY